MTEKNGLLLLLHLLGAIGVLFALDLIQLTLFTSTINKYFFFNYYLLRTGYKYVKLIIINYDWKQFINSRQLINGFPNKRFVTIFLLFDEIQRE